MLGTLGRVLGGLGTPKRASALCAGPTDNKPGPQTDWNGPRRGEKQRDAAAPVRLASFPEPSRVGRSRTGGRPRQREPPCAEARDPGIGEHCITSGAQGVLLGPPRLQVTHHHLCPALPEPSGGPQGHPLDDREADGWPTDRWSLMPYGRWANFPLLSQRTYDLEGTHVYGTKWVPGFLRLQDKGDHPTAMATVCSGRSRSVTRVAGRECLRISQRPT